MYGIFTQNLYFELQRQLSFYLALAPYSIGPIFIKNTNKIAAVRVISGCHVTYIRFGALEVTILETVSQAHVNVDLIR